MKKHIKLFEEYNNTDSINIIKFHTPHLQSPDYMYLPIGFTQEELVLLHFTEESKNDIRKAEIISYIIETHQDVIYQTEEFLNTSAKDAYYQAQSKKPELLPHKFDEVNWEDYYSILYNEALKEQVGYYELRATYKTPTKTDTIYLKEDRIAKQLLITNNFFASLHDYHFILPELEINGSKLLNRGEILTLKKFSDNYYDKHHPPERAIGPNVKKIHKLVQHTEKILHNVQRKLQAQTDDSFHLKQGLKLYINSYEI